MAKIKLSNNKQRRLEALADKAIALTAKGEHNTATAICNRADKEYKNFPYILYARGLIAIAQQDYNTAAEWLEQACLADPKPIEFPINYAACLFKMGLEEDAANMYQAICSKAPRLFEAHFGYGEALTALGEYRHAIQSYQKALKIKPANVKLIIAISHLYNQFDELDEALVLLHKANKANPKDGRIQFTLGLFLLQQGENPAGREHLRQAVTLNPSDITSLSLLIHSDKEGLEYKADLTRVQALYDQLDRNSEQWAASAFTLGAAANTAGQHEKAFAYWMEANEEKRKHVFFLEEPEKQLYQTAIDAFPANRFTTLDRQTSLSPDTAAPVFIVGMPRSGSTLLEQSLARHPELQAAGESNALRQSVNGRKRKGNYQDLIDKLRSLQDDEMLAITQEYARRLAAEYGIQGRCVDKTLDNFIFAGIIAKALPNARIIHIKREPMASCLSMFQQAFANTLTYTYNLDELGRQYARYQRIMRHWRNVLPAGVLLEVSYEELVSNQEGELRRLLKGCNLEWHDDCLTAHKGEGKVTTASLVQVRQPVHKQSVARWKHYEKQLEPIKQHLLD